MNTTTVTPQLSEAFEAAHALPVREQDALALSIFEHIEFLMSNVSIPARSPERQAIIKERMNQPFQAASREDLLAVLRKYDPTIQLADTFA